MKDKLGLKDIAPYLPYGLIVNFNRNNGMFKSDNVNLLNTAICYNESVKETFFMYGNVTYGLFDCTPLLRPLSDLTKEIEVNGKTFIPYEELEKNAVSEYWWQSINSHGIGPTAHFHLILLLLEWHFDIFGLIEKGLAIKK